MKAKRVEDGSLRSGREDGGAECEAGRGESSQTGFEAEEDEVE